MYRANLILTNDKQATSPTYIIILPVKNSLRPISVTFDISDRMMFLITMYVYINLLLNIRNDSSTMLIPMTIGGIF